MNPAGDPGQHTQQAREDRQHARQGDGLRVTAGGQGQDRGRDQRGEGGVRTKDQDPARTDDGVHDQRHDGGVEPVDGGEPRRSPRSPCRPAPAARSGRSPPPRREAATTGGSSEASRGRGSHRPTPADASIVARPCVKSPTLLGHPHADQGAAPSLHRLIIGGQQVPWHHLKQVRCTARERVTLVEHMRLRIRGRRWLPSAGRGRRWR